MLKESQIPASRRVVDRHIRTVLAARYHLEKSATADGHRALSSACSGRINPPSDTLPGLESLSVRLGIHDFRSRTFPLYCGSSPRLVRSAVSFRPRKKKFNKTKYHRCSRCGGQVRRRSVRCKKCAEPQKRK